MLFVCFFGEVQKDQVCCGASLMLSVTLDPCFNFITSQCVLILRQRTVNELLALVLEFAV